MLYECDKTNDMWNAIIHYLNKIFEPQNPFIMCLWITSRRYSNVKTSKTMVSFGYDTLYDTGNLPPYPVLNNGCRF